MYTRLKCAVVQESIELCIVVAIRVQDVRKVHMFVPYHHMSRQPRHLANVFSASRTSRLEARPYHSHHVNLSEASLLSSLPTSPMRAGDELEILPHTVCYPRPDDFRLGLPH